jgi:hypothetical protein
MIFMSDFRFKVTDSFEKTVSKFWDIYLRKNEFENITLFHKFL